MSAISFGRQKLTVSFRYKCDIADPSEKDDAQGEADVREGFDLET